MSQCPLCKHYAEHVRCEDCESCRAARAAEAGRYRSLPGVVKLAAVAAALKGRQR